MVSEFCLSWWKSELERVKSQTQSEAPRTVGSVITVCGALISFPSGISSPCPTPCLVAHRPPPAETALPKNAIAAFKKGFSAAKDINIGRGEGMPRSKDEWEPIMRFWSERLSRRPMEGLYEVLSGTAPV